MKAGSIGWLTTAIQIRLRLTASARSRTSAMQSLIGRVLKEYASNWMAAPDLSRTTLTPLPHFQSQAIPGERGARMAMMTTFHACSFAPNTATMALTIVHQRWKHSFMWVQANSYHARTHVTYDRLVSLKMNAKYIAAVMSKAVATFKLGRMRLICALSQAATRSTSVSRRMIMKV